MEQPPIDSRPAADPTDTMQAVTHGRYGDADVLHLANVARPVPGAGQVLVKVSAAGLDRGVWHVMTGKPYAARLALGLRHPRNPVLGLDVAGTVVALGSGVTRLARGDEVYGFGQGTFAEYTLAREDKLSPKPTSLTFEQAAAVPVSAVTALQALESGRIAAGQSVLVIGASGGVGGYAVQLATAIGAEVTGVCSTSKVDFVRSLGARDVVDYATQDFADGQHRYDLILDLAGNATVRRLRAALKPSGTVVIVGGEEGGSWTGSMDRQLRALAVSLFVRQRLTMFLTKQLGADLQRLTTLIESGDVTPMIDRTYQLEEVPEAMRALAAGQVRGKVVITV
ncbi:MAG TPA: NAD(P)-dependent alcohol dehydrogenase [Pedococcus sp.]|nr:NAD(P)-dependent alcohol dehydrogenase [Pedococcus sp.]